MKKYKESKHELLAEYGNLTNEEIRLLKARLSADLPMTATEEYHYNRLDEYQLVLSGEVNWYNWQIQVVPKAF
jgi:hypothetical protein